MTEGAEDGRWMGEAIAVAAAGLEAGELPVGAIVVAGGAVIGSAHTQERAQGRLLVHAELLALDQADRQRGWDRRAATLYSTVEPCLMCLGAAASAMVGRVVFAVPARSDGAATVVADWSSRRVAGLDLVSMPEVTAGVRRSDVERLLQRYLDRRVGEADGFTIWVRSLLIG